MFHSQTYPIWHPCSQMKDFEHASLLHVVRAQGEYLFLKNGKKIIDATSSWWCKSLGHQHPRLRDALMKQAHTLEHVIFASTVNDSIYELSDKLCSLLPSLNKILYASDGSSAVEMAIKMALQAHAIQGNSRSIIVKLKNAYHGETLGALAVSDLKLYKQCYPVLLQTKTIVPAYVLTIEDSVWQDAHESLQTVFMQLEKYKNKIAAIIVEPIVQAASGMRIYSQDFLKRLRLFAKEQQIYFISDEIMTGFGRTGKLFAGDHADIVPDFLCMGKNLTAGWLPMSAVLTSNEIYDLFYDDYASGKAFLHSHTFSGNALAASVAKEAFAILFEENLITRSNQIGALMFDLLSHTAKTTGRLKNVRQMGAMVAADLITHGEDRFGFRLAERAIANGALLRPLGNTIYWAPPLNVAIETLYTLNEITAQAIKEVT